jgi:hypothetical protein
MAEFAKLCRKDYRHKCKPITTRNPQANAIIEQVHQTIGNIIHTSNVQKCDDDDPWSGILVATMFAVHAMYHTTLKALPMQPVFGHDAILNIKHTPNWEDIRQQKQLKIDKNNKLENAKHVDHQYQIGDEILLQRKRRSKHKQEYEGPFELTAINYNGTVRFQKVL